MLIWATLVMAQDLSVAASGRWRLDESKAEVDRRLSSALDASVASVSAVFGELARPSLSRYAVACQSYTIAMTDPVFSVACDAKSPFTWMVGKTGAHRSDQGDDMMVSLVRSGAELTLDFAESRGGKKVTYAFTGDTLTVTQEIYSRFMKVPMRWSVRYRKG